MGDPVCGHHGTPLREPDRRPVSVPQYSRLCHDCYPEAFEVTAPTPPAPDPAALWALVRRWDLVEAREQDRAADAASDRDDISLLRVHNAAARTLDRCAAELAALLPPEAP